MVKKNILGTIGGTPMVRINRLCPNPNVNIYAKLEGFNPTGSIKDRIALRMIEEAEQDGRLTPGKTIIEPTSGNTGIGLAIVAIVKGYPGEIVMSSAVSVERRKIIRSYGAKVILTPAEEGTDGAIRLARSKVAGDPDKYFMPDQFANAGNYLAHYQSTALEIWQQTGGRIDYLVCAIGTSGAPVGVLMYPIGRSSGRRKMANAYERHDISDESWAKIEFLLPGRKGTWGGNARDNRQFINAVFWILRTGAPWRDLPPSYGDWKNTHRRFCRWRDKGVWEKLLQELIDNPEFELLMIDASHIKVHAHGSGARGGNQDMAKTKGGSTPRYIWPWMRMVCRSESLLQKVPRRIVSRLKP